MKRWCIPVVLALSLLLCPAAAAVTTVLLHPGGGFEQDLSLDPGGVFEIQVALKPLDESSVVTLRAETLNAQGTIIEFRQAERGFWVEQEWQLISVQLPVPDSAATSRIRIAAETAGEFAWKDLRYRKIATQVDEIRKFWEERLALYAPVYTGLVVDARHLPVVRSMSPRILSESGQLIYGGVFAPLEYVQEVGVVGYGPALAEPLTQRIAAHPSYPLILPLVIDAVAVAGSANTNLIISNADAQAIISSLAAYDFLARFAVVVLISPEQQP